MGSTVLTGKRAGAFQKADGEWIYALFERTYEKNCYPHHDEWSGIALGNYADVMWRVFLHATSCEGGMLQSRSGQIRPENYIESWRQELAKPMQLHDRQIDLRVGKAFDAPIPEKALDEVRQCLVDVGAEDRFAALVSGELPVSLFADVDLLISLYGEKGPFSIWRILSVDDCFSVPVDAPVPRLLPATAVMERMPEVRCRAIDSDNRLVAIGTDPWHHAGWQYSAVGSFITKVAYPREMEFPGFAKRAIPHFREIARTARPAPRETKVNVTRAPEGVNKWRLSTADEMARGLGIVGGDEPAPETFSFCLGEVMGELNGPLLYKLGGFDQSQVVWEVPDDSVIAEAPQSPLLVHDDSQLSLELL